MLVHRNKGSDSSVRFLNLLSLAAVFSLFALNAAVFDLGSYAKHTQVCKHTPPKMGVGFPVQILAADAPPPTFCEGVGEWASERILKPIQL